MNVTYRDMHLANKFAKVDRSTKTKFDNRSGFTIVEVITVIGIIGILLALSFPAVQTVRQAARRTQCASNIRQVLTATMVFESTGKGLPKADDGNGGGFIISLLPFLEQPLLYDRSREPLLGAETFQNRLSELSNTRFPTVLCPASSFEQTVLPDQGQFTIHYYGVAGPSGSATTTDGTYQYNIVSPSPSAGPIGTQGMFSPTSRGTFIPRRLRDVKDGLSNTFSIGEISDFNNDIPLENRLVGGWAFGAGYNSNRVVTNMYGMKTLALQINSNINTLNDMPFSSNHAGGSQFGFGDVAVRFVSDRISVDVLKTFASINENEEIGDLERY